MGIEISILILLIIASIVAILAERFNLPFTIALVAMGLIFGSMRLFIVPHLSKELLYYIFLPPLIFQTALHLKLEDLRRDFPVILTLVIPGVILSTVVTAFVFVGFGEKFFHNNISFIIGLLFGAAVAATDPVAVINIFEKLGVPNRLRFLLDSESLLNDGTAIVVFTIVLEILNKQFTSYEFAVMNFFYVVGMGLIIGYFIGLIIDEIIKRVDNPMIVITLTTVAAYLSFIIADKMELSGVMSTVAAGLVIGTRSFANPIYPTIKVTTETFWEYITFLANMFIFLLIGFTVDIHMLLNYWQWILVAYVAMMVARFFVVFVTWGIFSFTTYKFPFSWSVIMGLGGIRGALTMVLAMSLPDNFKYKELIVTLVFGIVLLSIFIQGSIMPLFLKIFNLTKHNEKLTEFEIIKTKILITQKIISELNELQSKKLITDKIYQELIQEYRNKLNELNEMLNQFQIDTDEDVKKEEKLKIKRELLMEEKQFLMDLYHKGEISIAVYKKLAQDIDAEIFEIENEL